MSECMLKLENIVAGYGYGPDIINNINLELNKGDIKCIIGPNGAGKSTLFNCISRVYPIDEGEIYLGDTRIDTMPAHKIASLGVGRSFQLTRVLDELSVTENLSLHTAAGFNFHLLKAGVTRDDKARACLLYTSDAADE